MNECSAVADRHAAASFTDDGTEVVVARLVTGSESVRAARAVLTDAERQRARRLSSARQRGRFIVGRARLRQLLGTRLGVRPREVELVYGARGKPVLAPRFADADLHFNVAHCDDVAVYGFSRGREIGIDVEAVRVIRGADTIALRFFSRSERAAYQALDPRDKPLGFFNCWTRKEAFIKALGDGLYYSLDRFDVSLEPGIPAKILRIENILGTCGDWRMESFSPPPGFVAAIVTKRRTSPQP